MPQLRLPRPPDPRTREGLTKYAQIVVGHATSFTVRKLITQNIEIEDDARLQRANVYIGSHMVGAMVADKSKERIAGTIDGLAEKFADAKKMFAEAKAEAEARYKTESY